MQSDGHARFAIEPLARFAKQSLSRQPVELTSFSFDEKRQLHHDDRSLAYYWPAKLDTNLSDGFEKLISRDDESVNEHIDAILEALIRYESAHGTAKTTVDVITWRGLITKLLVLPYSLDTGFELNATRLDKTLYIEEHISDATRTEKAKQFEDKRQRMMAYWALATIPKSWDETNRSVIEERNYLSVNTNVQYCSIVRTRLGPVSLVLGGEVDCCYDYKPTITTEPLPNDDFSPMKTPGAGIPQESIVSHYVELKTCKIIQSDRDRSNFEKFKMLKFWAQSFLLGVPRIIVGFRDNNGMLINEEEFETLRLPGLVRQGSSSWDGNVCINFAGEALAFICASIKSPGVYRIRYKSRSTVLEVIRMAAEGHGSILTKEFIEHRQHQP